VPNDWLAGVRTGAGELAGAGGVAAEHGGIGGGVVLRGDVRDGKPGQDGGEEESEQDGEAREAARAWILVSETTRIPGNGERHGAVRLLWQRIDQRACASLLERNESSRDCGVGQAGFLG
jgi:hypothetical protein